MNFKIDSSFATEAERKDFNPKKVFENFLMGAMRLAYKDGIGMEYQRRIHKIMDKLDACTNSGADFLELEDAEFALVKEAFDRAKFPAENHCVVCQIYDFIEAAKEPAQEKKEEQIVA